MGWGAGLRRPLHGAAARAGQRGGWEWGGVGKGASNDAVVGAEAAVEEAAVW